MKREKELQRLKTLAKLQKIFKKNGVVNHVFSAKEKEDLEDINFLKKNGFAKEFED